MEVTFSSRELLLESTKHETHGETFFPTIPQLGLRAASAIAAHRVVVRAPPNDGRVLAAQRPATVLITAINVVYVIYRMT